MSKDQRIKTAQETLRIIADDGYRPAGALGPFYPLSVDTLVQRTVYYDPDTKVQPAEVTITDQTTLEAAHEMVKGGHCVGVLNFASAKNPGGGFLQGTLAQEESLAYASTLYASLNSDVAKPYYEAHRAAKDPRYSNRMIYSPGVTVFRDDHGSLLPSPYQIDVLTAAAPNRRDMEQKGDVDEEKFNLLIESRVFRALHLFSNHSCNTLVLGAWGCGVFGNDPNTVAGMFASYLRAPGGIFSKNFRRVVFAIHGSERNLKEFVEWFHTKPRRCTEVQ